MPEIPIRREINEILEEVAALVQRALVEVGDLREVEEKLKELSDKAAKYTAAASDAAEG